MLFGGLSQTHGLRLLDLISNEKYEEALKVPTSVLYKDTFYLLRFTEILLENIKRVHVTLNYILRTQYRDADKIYNEILKGKSTEADLSSTLTTTYENDVFKYLIAPQMRKYGMYSPIISYMITLGLVNSMYVEYISKSWESINKEHLRRVTKIDLEYIESIIDTISNKEMQEIMRCELQVWKEQKAKHFKKRT